MPRSDISRNIAYNLVYNYIVLAVNYKSFGLVLIMDIVGVCSFDAYGCSYFYMPTQSFIH